MKRSIPPLNPRRPPVTSSHGEHAAVSEQPDTILDDKHATMDNTHVYQQQQTSKLQHTDDRAESISQHNLSGLSTHNVLELAGASPWTQAWLHRQRSLVGATPMSDQMNQTDIAPKELPSSSDREGGETARIVSVTIE